ncbi:putative TonB-dependent transmembrane receptor protein [Candidatus Zixiibacteriota bacterium]|nr:putative TonB-dependent transmembrane receptor protein [candidate division Zixibacteria bacterium]
MKYPASILILMLFAISGAAASQLTGRVVDNHGRAIPGVNVLTDQTSLNSVTDSTGNFALVYTGMGPTHITFSHISYQPAMIAVKPGTVAALEITLQPAILPGQKIVVTANRAVSGVSPMTYSDFSNDDIKRDYAITEFPLLLETTPNMYSYADAGGGLGYSYMKIRGFDDKRISVYINGVPLNDPEDQATYFVDIPDFAADVTDIQVQRGVGNSLYGEASFGGLVNIASNGLERPRKVTLTTGWGGFYAGSDFVSQMRKNSVEYTSGLLDGRWSLSGRYSNQYSGGYRLNSWYNGWAYYLSLSRLDPKMTTTLNLYGGPMKMHLAYYGIGRVTEKIDRRTNYLTYPDETDNFNQPHFELHNTYRVNDKLILHNTLFYITGKGYYEQYKTDQSYNEYNIFPEATVDSTTQGNIDVQKWVTKSQFGWSPRLDWDHGRGNLSVGGSFYYFHSDHWGDVIWAQGLTPTVGPEHRYYEYFGKKYWSSSYINEYYTLSDHIRLMGNLQLKYLTYNFDGTPIGLLPGYKYKLHWLFLSPRGGITYRFHDNADMYFSTSVSSREPEDVTIYDAEEVGTRPALQIKSIRVISPGDTSFVFGDPFIKPERVYDFELGGHLRGEKFNFGANLFWMEFRHEIVPEGGLDENGRPRVGNADRSVHSGIELNGSYLAARGFNISANASYNHNILKKYFVYADNGQGGIDSLNYSGNPVAGFPDVIGNLIFDYDYKPVRLTWRWRGIGRQYVDNGKMKDLSIDPYVVSSLTASAMLGNVAGMGRLTLSADLNNIFNKKYELSGYSYLYDGEWYAEYFPAAERNFFLQLKWELD